MKLNLTKRDRVVKEIYKEDPKTAITSLIIEALHDSPVEFETVGVGESCLYPVDTKGRKFVIEIKDYETGL